MKLKDRNANARRKSQEFGKKKCGDKSKFLLRAKLAKVDQCMPSVCLYWTLLRRESKALTIMKQYHACVFPFQSQGSKERCEKKLST